MDFKRRVVPHFVQANLSGGALERAKKLLYKLERISRISLV